MLPFLLLFLLPFAAAYLLRRKTDNLYGLDHALLNSPVPPPTMWMNMGYWKSTTSFPTACHSLLILILTHAGLLDPAAAAGGRGPPSRKLWIIDLGFGCGDQTIAIHELLPGIMRYDGISNNPVQHAFAKQRVQSGVARNARLHIADGGDPETWGLDPVAAAAAAAAADEVWTVALDSLYHFRPSRGRALGRVAALGSSLVAFDLLASERAGWGEKLALWGIAKGMQVPYGNFLTEAGYVDMLVGAGYAKGAIEVVDISEDVFGGLSRFLKERGKQVGAFGIGGWGRWRVAGWVFGLFAKWQLVRGCVVIARMPRVDSKSQDSRESRI